MCTRTQEKGAVTPKETDPDLPVSVQESLAESWVSGGLLLTRSTAGLEALSEAVHAWDLLKEVAIKPTIEPPELTQDWGNRLLEGTNKTLCIPGPRREGQ